MPAVWPVNRVKPTVVVPVTTFKQTVATVVLVAKLAKQVAVVVVAPVPIFKATMQTVVPVAMFAKVEPFVRWVLVNVPLD